MHDCFIYEQYQNFHHTFRLPSMVVWTLGRTAVHMNYGFIRILTSLSTILISWTGQERFDSLIFTILSQNIFLCPRRTARLSPILLSTLFKIFIFAILMVVFSYFLMLGERTYYSGLKRFGTQLLNNFLIPARIFLHKTISKHSSWLHIVELIHGFDIMCICQSCLYKVPSTFRFSFFSSSKKRGT